MSDLRDSMFYTYSVNNIPYNDTLIYTLEPTLNTLISISPLNTYNIKKGSITTLPSLSNTFYNTIDWWWLLGIINGIDNVYKPINPSLLFYYPSVDQLGNYKNQLSSLLALPQYASGTDNVQIGSSLSNIYTNGIVVF